MAQNQSGGYISFTFKEIFKNLGHTLQQNLVKFTISILSVIYVAGFFGQFLEPVFFRHFYSGKLFLGGCFCDKTTINLAFRRVVLNPNDGCDLFVTKVNIVQRVSCSNWALFLIFNTFFRIQPFSRSIFRNVNFSVVV